VKLDWKAILGLLISGLLLWWVFRGEDLHAIWTEIQGANWLLLLAAVAVATFGFVIRAARWGILLEPLERDVGFRPRFASVCIGFAANNLLPARIGEFARAYALSRMTRVTASGAIGSLVVERFLDGVAIFGLMALAVFLPGFPGEATIAGQSVGFALRGVLALFLLLLVILVLLLMFPGPVVHFTEAVASRVLPQRLANVVREGLEAFLEGLTVLQDPVLLVRALAWSFGFWAWHSISFWLGFLAFGIHVGYPAALFVNAVIAMGVAVPSAPGFIGTFHAAAKVGLSEVYGVPEGPTLAFAFGYHLGGFIPVTLMGLYYAWRLGISFKEVEESEERIEDTVADSGPEGRA
jgi:uncharacterized protein (TIRG00374 family)